MRRIPRLYLAAGLIAISSLLYAPAHAQRCYMTMCADGSHVRCCGANCCPGAAPKGSGSTGLGLMLMQSVLQGVIQGVQRPPPQQPQPTPEELERKRLEEERLREQAAERERKGRDEEERRRRERQELLRTQKGEPLPEGPLPLKDGAVPDAGEGPRSDPWCWENAPKGDCDQDWETRCGKGAGFCLKQVLARPPVEAQGACETNVAEGGKRVDSPLAGHPPGSPALRLAPKHNSRNPTASPWGNGWHTELDQRLALWPGFVVWTDEFGTKRRFLEREPGARAPKPYAAPLDTPETLTAVEFRAGEPERFELRSKDGTLIEFRRSGASSDYLPARLVDRIGSANVYTRDARGRLTGAIDAHGRTLALAYDDRDRVASVDDGAGRVVRYAYDYGGNKIREETPEGVLRYAYDEWNRITRIAYPNGGSRSFAYDGEGRLAEEYNELAANRRRYEYFPSSTAVTDSLGRRTIYELSTRDGVKKIGRIVDPAGGATAFGYDDGFRLARQTDPLGAATSFGYDAAGNLVQTRDPLGGRTALAYEPRFSRVVSVTDPRGTATTLHYDDKGNLGEVRDALGNATRFSYDPLGHAVAASDALGKATRFEYDPRTGALTAATDPLGRVARMTRDALGRVTELRDAAGKATRFEYDAAGNLIQVTDQAGGITRYGYAPGRGEGMLLESVIDAKRNATRFAYDALGRLVAVTNPLGQEKRFAYDEEGNLTRVTDAKGREIRFAYDALDRLVRKELPEGTVEYEYDAAGNLTRLRHYNGSELSSKHDALGRVTSAKQTFPGGFSVELGYAYDAAGNRTKMTTPWGNFGYEYDALNRVTSITNPDGKKFAFEYDALGRRTKLVYPNGVVATYAYDDASQLLEIKHARSRDGSLVALARYTYDAAGNRTSMTDLAGTHSYAYDDLHRLIGAIHPRESLLPVKKEGFRYDAVGNRLADAEIRGYRYDQANRLLENSRFVYEHDENGNQIAKTEKRGKKTTRYYYDSENQLVRVELPDGTESSYKYDGLGKRVEKRTGAAGSPTVLRYVYDNEDILAVLDAGHNPLSLMTHGPGIDELLMLREKEELTVHNDALGSVLAEAGPQDTIRYAYDAYGNRVSPGNGRAWHGFGGRSLDVESGFYHHFTREYDPTIGRFIQSEPRDEVPYPNRYEFVRNNPALFTDPTGLDVTYYLVNGFHFAFRVDDAKTAAGGRAYQYIEYYPAPLGWRNTLGALTPGSSATASITVSPHKSPGLYVPLWTRRTTAAEDARILAQARYLAGLTSSGGYRYNLFGIAGTSNCFTFRQDLLAP